MISKPEIVKRADDVGVRLTDRQAECFLIYSKELGERAKEFNLTAVSPERYLEEHFIDSMTLFQTGLFRAGSNCCDLGAGAGFPGIPLSIVDPRINMLLIESNSKKCDFIRRVIDRLALGNAAVYHGRAESAGRDPKIRSSMDIACARAVAPLPVLLEYGLPVVKVGGWFLAMKGPRSDEGSGRSERAAEILGGRISGSIEPKGSELGSNKRIIAVEKVKQTPIQFPRRIGVPKKRPLGET